MPRQLQAPAKELRFTRSGQAPAFWVVGAVLAAAAMTLVVCGLYRDVNPLLPHPLWALLPLAVAWALLRTAVRLTRHAYLILTPLGLEIFPFFRPATGLRLVTWAEIHAAEVDADLTQLTLHHDAERSSGVHLSLKPIRTDKLPLLVQALAGRIAAAKPNTVRLALHGVEDGPGQNARATGGAGILPVTILARADPATLKLTVLDAAPPAEPPANDPP